MVNPPGGYFFSRFILTANLTNLANHHTQQLFISICLIRMISRISGQFFCAFFPSARSLSSYFNNEIEHFTEISEGTRTLLDSEIFFLLLSIPCLFQLHMINL